MKIQSDWRSSGKQLRLNETASLPHAPQQSFQEAMQQHEEKASQEQLRQRLEHIRSQGDRLSRSMTVRELRAYKTMVKQFLEETVRMGVTLRETSGWDSRGRGRRYKLLEEVDRMLLELGEEMLQIEEGRLRILNSVGEIRGLLIHLLY